MKHDPKQEEGQLRAGESGIFEEEGSRDQENKVLHSSMLLKSPVSACACLLVSLTLLLAAELLSGMEVDEDSAAAPKSPGEPALCSSPCRFIRGVSPLWFCRRFHRGCRIRVLDRDGGGRRCGGQDPRSACFVLCSFRLARCVSLFLLSQVPSILVPPLQVQQKPARCAADGCKGVLLSCSCVLRVSMLGGSLCCELCLQPAVCVLLVAAQDLTLAV